MQVFELSTNGYHQADRFSAWREEVAPNCAGYELKLSKAGAKQFNAHATIVKVSDEITFARMKSNSLEAIRGLHHIRDGNDNFTFHINRRGGTHIYLDKEDTRHSMIELQGVLLNNAIPGKTVKVDPPDLSNNVSYIFDLPRDTVLKFFPAADRYCLQTSNSKSSIFQYLVQFADSISNAKAIKQNSTIESGHLITLIGWYLTSGKEYSRSQAFGPENESPLLSLILNHIDNNFFNSALNGSEIASKFGISQRYLQILLATTGESFVDHVNRRRLNLAKSLLENQAGKRTPIASVAFAVGFRNPSYFNRCFINAFGCTPLEYFLKHHDTRRTISVSKS